MLNATLVRVTDTLQLNFQIVWWMGLSNKQPIKEEVHILPSMPIVLEVEKANGDEVSELEED